MAHKREDKNSQIEIRETQKRKIPILHWENPRGETHIWEGEGVEVQVQIEEEAAKIRLSAP